MSLSLMWPSLIFSSCFAKIALRPLSPVDILQHEERGADHAADDVAEGQVQDVHVGGVISGALGEQIKHFLDANDNFFFS